MVLKIKALFDDLFLLSGENLIINDNIFVKHPSVQDIWNLGDKINCDKTYSLILSNILCDPYDHMVMLDDYGIDYETITAFDVFVLKWQQLLHTYIKNKEIFDGFNYNPLSEMIYSLNFFLNSDSFQLLKDEAKDEYYLKNPYAENYIITKSIFNYIVEFVAQINNISSKDRIKPKNKFAKQVLIEDKREELNRLIKKKDSEPEKEKPNSFIAQYVKAACFTGENGINIFNVKKVKLYPLIMACKKHNDLMGYNFLMSAIYGGTIDSKKIKTEDFNWMS